MTLDELIQAAKDAKAVLADAVHAEQSFSVAFESARQERIRAGHAYDAAEKAMVAQLLTNPEIP